MQRSPAGVRTSNSGYINDRAEAICAGLVVAPNGDAIVVGGLDEPCGERSFVRRHSTNSTVDGTTPLGTCPSPRLRAVGFGASGEVLAVGGSGNVYAGGRTTTYGTSTSDFVIVKLGPDGALAWTQVFEVLAGRDDLGARLWGRCFPLLGRIVVHDVATRSDGSVDLAGEIEPGVETDAFVADIDPQGHPR